MLAVLACLAGVGIWLADPVANPFSQTRVTQADSPASEVKPSADPGATAPNPSVATNASVVKVTDGDTIEVKLDAEPGKDFKIRLLGVNTPETVDPRRPVQCFGKEASDFTKHMLSGKRIRLDPDPQADERDKYDRLLRNVVLDDGTDFNARLVSDGYAYAYLDFPLNPARKTLLRTLERQAKEAGKGLWAPGACP